MSIFPRTAVGDTLGTLAVIAVAVILVVGLGRYCADAYKRTKDLADEIAAEVAAEVAAERASAERDAAAFASDMTWREASRRFDVLP